MEYSQAKWESWDKDRVRISFHDEDAHVTVSVSRDEIDAIIKDLQSMQNTVLKEERDAAARS